MMLDRGYLLSDTENEYLEAALRDDEDVVIEAINNQIQKTPNQDNSEAIARLINRVSIAREEAEKIFINDMIERTKKRTIYDVLTQVYQHATKNRKILVCYAQPPPEGAQLGVDALALFLDKMAKVGNCNHVLIITAVSLTPPANNKLKEYPAYTIEIFLEKDLTYNLTKHYRVPKHKGLPKDKMVKFLAENKKYQVDESPIILTTDPVARYYGFQVGQIVKVKRVNLLESITKTFKSYRLVQKPDYDVQKLAEENKRKVESNK